MQRDPVLASLARSAEVSPTCRAPGTPIAHNEWSLVVASLARSSAIAPYELLVFTCAEAGSAAATAVLAAMVAASHSVPELHELEPTVVPDDVLRQWERMPTDLAPRGTDETSPDGRWLWVIAIALVAVEEWIRRRSPRRTVAPVTEVTHERVA
jgi:hypothetical protein